MSRLVAVVVLSCLGGCHARFQKHVGQIEEVRPQTLVSAGPSVVLGGVSGDGAVAAVVNVVQGVRSIQAAQKLAESVDITGVNQAFTEGLRKSIGEGPPFGTTLDKEAALLSAEVRSYGLVSPAMGVQGTFDYSVRVEIFLPDGKKVYNNTETCHVGFGEASELSQVLGTVDNVKQLDRMTDAEIQGTFEAASRLCGQQIVLEMRRHAS